MIRWERERFSIKLNLFFLRVSYLVIENEKKENHRWRKGLVWWKSAQESVRLAFSYRGKEHNCVYYSPSPRRRVEFLCICKWRQGDATGGWDFSHVIARLCYVYVWRCVRRPRHCEANAIRFSTLERSVHAGFPDRIHFKFVRPSPRRYSRL